MSSTRRGRAASSLRSVCARLSFPPLPIPPCLVPERLLAWFARLPACLPVLRGAGCNKQPWSCIPTVRVFVPSASTAGTHTLLIHFGPRRYSFAYYTEYCCWTYDELFTFLCSSSSRVYWTSTTFCCRPGLFPRPWTRASHIPTHREAMTRRLNARDPTRAPAQPRSSRRESCLVFILLCSALLHPTLLDFPLLSLLHTPCPIPRLAPTPR
jgi:hypothetical protein